jgi:hypothetical protein
LIVPRTRGDLPVIVQSRVRERRTRISLAREQFTTPANTFHMNRLLEKIDRSLFPEKFRNYITFRYATVFVAIVAIGSTALDMLSGRPDLPPKSLPQIDWLSKLAHTPGFMALHTLILALGFWLIYATREKKQYYRFRVLFYGMLLGGLAGELLDYCYLFGCKENVSEFS